MPEFVVAWRAEGEHAWRGPYMGEFFTNREEALEVARHCARVEAGGRIEIGLLRVGSVEARGEELLSPEPSAA